MKQYFVIGNPINHSLSPNIFNYIFDVKKIQASYSPYLADNDDVFINFINSNRKKVSGFNITSPFKELAYNIVDEIDDSAKFNKSVNCIKVSHSKLIGYNTDEYGFIEMIKMHNLSLNGKNVIILGYGGVAKTITVALKHHFNCHIYIFGRNNAKINHFIHSFDQSINTLESDNSKNNFIVINCLPFLIDKKNSEFILKTISLKNINFFIDINYKETNIYKSIRKKCKSLIGLDMLIFQALKSYDIWFENKYDNLIDYNQLKEVIINQ